MKVAGALVNNFHIFSWEYYFATSWL